MKSRRQTLTGSGDGPCPFSCRWPPGSALAVAAPDAGTLADGGVLQRAAAVRAGQPITAVHQQLLLEVARCAVGADEIAQGGTATGDRIPEDLLHRVGQPLVALARNLSRLAQRADAGLEQDFGSVDVAHAHHHRLVHQEGLHRRAATTAAGEQVIAIEGIVQRLRAQALQQRVDLAGRLPQQAAEAARVVEAQQAAIVEADVDVVVRTQRGITGQHAQAAGHAKVQHRAADGGVQQQVLCAPADVLDALTRQQLGHFRWNRPAQVGAAQDHPMHAATLQVRRQAAAGGFDFGQFRHAEILRLSAGHGRAPAGVLSAAARPARAHPGTRRRWHPACGSAARSPAAAARG
ncbi:hypothetical protein G6F22_010760 [Rhizopus arrhizus]|nr:hypothetical protein G6F22_010760 [Rhizopus arrhizus]